MIPYSEEPMWYNWLGNWIMWDFQWEAELSRDAWIQILALSLISLFSGPVSSPVQCGQQRYLTLEL